MSTFVRPLPVARGLFVTGTDTGVGKTYVSCLLAEVLKRRGLKVAVMKPVAAGVEADGMNGDVRLLMASSNVPAPPSIVNPYCFAPAIAPHLAARQAGISMRLDIIERAYAHLAERADVVLVEGAGGFLVPFNAECGMDAIPRRLRLPVAMVVGLRLGCLNHAQLTAEAVTARGLELAGWFANRVDPDMKMSEENLASLRSILRSPCLGEIPWEGSSTRGLALDESRIFKAIGLES
ncbi:MAG: dethiobiotin synthase [Pseudomonadota bacterium]